VLIRGEAVSARISVARAVHVASTQRHGPFVKVNCAAIPQDLLESELVRSRARRLHRCVSTQARQFEYANKGTIYLDEIAELPMGLQAKLLHVLQDFRMSRVGGTGMFDIDVRVIAATNRDLETAMTRGEFREDLYYRLNVVEIPSAPRERREGNPGARDVFLAKFNAQYGRQKQFVPGTLGAAPGIFVGGNVRELENAVRRLVRALRRRAGRGSPGGPPAQRPRGGLAAGGHREPRKSPGAGRARPERKALEEVHRAGALESSRGIPHPQGSYKTLLTRSASAGSSRGLASNV